MKDEEIGAWLNVASLLAGSEMNGRLGNFRREK